MESTRQQKVRREAAARLAPRIRDADYDDPLAPGPDPAVHGWHDLVSRGTRALTDAERSDLRATLRRRVVVAVLFAGIALLFLGFAVSFGARGMPRTAWADLVIAAVCGYGAWVYYAQSLPAREDLRRGEVEVLEAPVPLRSDGGPAQVVEVESGGVRSRIVTAEAPDPLPVEVLPVSRRVWTISGSRMM